MSVRVGGRQWASVRVARPLQTPTSEIVATAVLDGVGIACSPTWLYPDLINTGEVQVLLPGWQISLLPLKPITPPERRPAAEVWAFDEHRWNALASSALRLHFDPPRASGPWPWPLLIAFAQPSVMSTLAPSAKR